MAEGRTKPRTGEYVSRREQALAGNPHIVEPLDYILMGELNPVGTLFAGAYPDGHTAAQLGKIPSFEGKLDPNHIILPRLKSLESQGFVQAMAGVTNKRSVIWQVTEEGKALTDAWRAKQKGKP